MALREPGTTPMKTIPFLLLLSTVCHAMGQRPEPAPVQTRSILVQGGTVHVGDGRLIMDGVVGFRNGRIDHVGNAATVTATYDTVIDARGMEVYPGLILPDATLGLGEIDQVNATMDEREAGDRTPEVRAIAAYNADSRIIPTVRRNGVLLAQICPRGGIISGTSSIVQLDAWGTSDATVRVDDGVHLVWPDRYDRNGWWAEPGPTVKAEANKREAILSELEDRFLRASAYAQRTHPDPVDVRSEALKGLFTGARTLFVHADEAIAIQEAVLFARRVGVQRMVLVGGYDAWRVGDLLRENKVPVILRRLHSLPLREDDDIDLPYRLPALMKAQGLTFCLGYSGGMERMGSRNLPFVAGTAAAYGLDPEEALRAVTFDAARILGISNDYGSLQEGLSATLFISRGNVLDMRTNDVVMAFIDGRALHLDGIQESLFERYRRHNAGPGH